METLPAPFRKEMRPNPPFSLRKPVPGVTSAKTGKFSSGIKSPLLFQIHLIFQAVNPLDLHLDYSAFQKFVVG